ncbi:MAG: YggT family protein [Rhodanobacteraceae bacterium]|nr:YggT family protein [Xanthomonadales bacterium]MCP5479376.1 YggT family protein [Rhodanobacteraceae bacterium]HRY00064.1 YggT family protein [Xanthomonadaceae bacterium]
MSYLLTAAALLIELAFGLVTALFLLRLALPLVRANFRNPICQTIYRLSHPVVAPVGRLLKPIGRFDLASAVLIWLLQCLKFLLLYALGGLLPTLPGLLVLGLAGVVEFVLVFGFWLILISAIFSFFPQNAYHPLAQLTKQLSEPLLRPIRRFLPSVGGFDLSPMLAMLLLVLARILLAAPLHDLGGHLARG